jgi:hemerythrin-like domain-containing protein
MTETTIFDRMRRDHKNVLERVSALERGVLRAKRGARAPSTAERDRALLDLIGHLTRQFATHMAGEDRVLFPELQPLLPRGEAALDPLREEHEEMRAMLIRLQETLRRRAGAARDEEIVVQARDLIDLLRLHIRKEEILLGVAERVLTPPEIEALDARIRALPEFTTRAGRPEARPGGRS